MPGSSPGMTARGNFGHRKCYLDACAARPGHPVRYSIGLTPTMRFAMRPNPRTFPIALHRVTPPQRSGLLPRRSGTDRRLTVEPFLPQLKAHIRNRADAIDADDVDAVEIAAFPVRHGRRIAAELLHQRPSRQHRHGVLPPHQNVSVMILRASCRERV